MKARYKFKTLGLAGTFFNTMINRYASSKDVQFSLEKYEVSMEAPTLGHTLYFIELATNFASSPDAPTKRGNSYDSSSTRESMRMR